MANHKVIIDVSLAGQQQTLSGLDAVIAKTREAGKVSVNKIYDAQGNVTGAQIKQSLDGIGDAAAKATPKSNDLVNALRRAVIVAPVWMLARGAIMSVLNTFQDQIKFLVEFETAMTRIKIVGKGTEGEYKLLAKSLIDLGHAYGASSTEAATAAVLFAQQGRNVRDTITLTATAMLASKILGTDIKTAVDDMTAAVEGFQLGVDDSTKIVDKWINVEKQFAVTSKDLADATKVAGAAANQLGITMNQFLGDVTAIVEVTRKSGAEAARGLTFIYARLLTSAKTTIEQIAKVPFYLDKTGQSTNVVGTSLRSISSILEDLATKWSTLDTKEKLSIATSLGSKRQMTVLYALMQNYNTSLDARIAGLTSAGAAEKAFNLIQDTTAYKVQQLGSAWNVFTAALANTDGFKSSISAFDQLLLGITTLINYKAGYAAITAKENVSMQMVNDTTLNQVKSLEELLTVKQKLAKAPQTDDNINRMKLIQDAVDAISAKEPKIKVAIDTGTPEELKSVIQKRLDVLENMKVRINLLAEFGPQEAAIQNRIEAIKADISLAVNKQQNIELSKQLVVEETKLKQIYADEEKAVQSQLKINKGLEASKKEILDNSQSEEEVAAELTLQEIEKLDIAQKLNLAKESGLLTETELLNLEEELITSSKYQYEAHKEVLKVKELESKMASAELKDSKDLIDNELELLKLRGANSSQLFEIESALKMQLYGTNVVKNSLQYQFELEKQITKEKLNQVEISNDSLSLYKLAQKYGVTAAQEVSALLSGALTPGGFENFAGGAAKQGYAEFFASRKEAEDAATYFGLKGGRQTYAEGGGIAIPERDLGKIPSIEEMKKQYGIESGIVASTRLVSIQSIQVNVTPSEDKEKTAEQMQLDIADAIRTDSKVRAALDEKIAEF